LASRIEDYAMLGDGRTAALVSRTGCIDWLCLPRFDASACCAALLGTEENGRWQLAPCEATGSERRYQDDTLVLQTDFTGARGVVRLTDFMDVAAPQPTLIRIVEGLHGTLRMHCTLAPRFDYGLMPPRCTFRDDAWVAIAGADLLALRSDVVLWETMPGTVSGEFDVVAGQKLAFILSHGPSHLAPPDAKGALARTLRFWRDWTAQFQFATPWRDAVMRSLLTLKALT
jgi:GH15 family glucan-1,4-alpha-glucosidase